MIIKRLVISRLGTVIKTLAKKKKSENLGKIEAILTIALLKTVILL